MSIHSVLSRSAAPPVAVELAAGYVSAAAIEVRRGRPVVLAHASEPLPEGAIVPSLTAANIVDRSGVIGALGRVFDRMGGRPRRVGVVIPDPAAKISLVRFEHVPAKRQDLDQLVKWQVRKAAPFPVEQAQISYTPGSSTAEGREFVVTLARRDIIEDYEGVCLELGAHPGIVDLATFNIVNSVLAEATPPSGDWLLVHAADDYASIAILRGPQLVFFRNRVANTEGTFADLVHQTGMYYEDRLGGTGFGRVILAGGARTRHAEEFAQVRRSLEERLTSPINAVDPRSVAALTDRISASPLILETLAPLVGLLVRKGEAA